MDLISSILNIKKVPTAKVHAKLSDGERNVQVNAFEANQVTFLMTTNLMSRAVDFSKVRMVINYDLPDNVAASKFDMKTYLYRIERCGRFGN